jgi:hypothetical protein
VRLYRVTREVLKNKRLLPAIMQRREERERRGSYQRRVPHSLTSSPSDLWMRAYERKYLQLWKQLTPVVCVAAKHAPNKYLGLVIIGYPTRANHDLFLVAIQIVHPKQVPSG